MSAYELDEGPRLRLGAIAVLVAAAATVVGIVMLGSGSSSYAVTAEFQNAGQLVNGNYVSVDGLPVGTVSDISLSDDGQAIVKLEITDPQFKPLRAGTRAVIRQFSQSGIASRFVDLLMPPGSGGPTIPDGGRVGIDDTRNAVDIDELFNTLDRPTRKGLQGTLKGLARQYAGRGEEANAGYLYLNPGLSSAAALFNELNRDRPLLARFLVDSSRLVGAVAERRAELSQLIGHLDATTAALGEHQTELASAVGRLPGFMRQANTTFVNLRTALDDLQPLLDASKPVAARLDPFLDEARPFARDAKPTVRDLNRVLRRPGAGNDLYELLRTSSPLADIATETKERQVDFGGGVQELGTVDGAFPQAVDALDGARPIIAAGRPYTPDLVGWFKDFSSTGTNDAISGFDRVQAYFNAFSIENGAITFLDPTSRPENFKQLANIGQFHRCPGANEVPAPDSSNVLSEAEQDALDCRESDRGTGPLP